MRYNGIDPTTLHRGISIAKEIPPGAPTSQLETLTGASGEIITGRTLKQAEYIVRINIAGKTREEAWGIREKLAAWACSADETTHELVPTRWPGMAYDAIFKEITPPEFVFGFAVVDVIFAIPRPIAHSVNERSVSGSSVAEFAVMGTSYARPEINITMVSGYRAEITVDGKLYAAVSYPFQSGDVMSVQTNPPGVVIATSGSVIQADRYVDYAVTDLDAMCKALTPGRHSITCAQASGISVRWREEYL